MKEQLRQLVQATDGPLGAVVVILALLSLVGWQVVQARLGGRRRTTWFGSAVMVVVAVGVLGLAIARIGLLK